MAKRKKFEKHIAVFGQSGSGKTTLLSVFYGYQQSAAFIRSSGYSLLSLDTTQGQKLLQAYHRIEDDLLPPQTRYRQNQFTFAIRLDGLLKDAANLVWHDYPGEWWTETKEEEEADRKIAAFQALMCSDIAFILIDGQKLYDNARLDDNTRLDDNININNYISHVFKGFRDELNRRRDEILNGEKGLENFPRIWTICLSKADMFPDVDVEWFRKIVSKAATDEIDELRKAIQGFVTAPECVSIGEDYLLLSSAQFATDTGRVKGTDKTIGVDLIAPISISSPLDHTLKWVKIHGKIPIVTKRIADTIRGMTFGWMKLIPIIGYTFHLLDDLAQEGIVSLQKRQEKAIRSGDALGAVLSALRVRLKAEKNQKFYIHPL